MKEILRFSFDVQGHPIDLSGQNNHGLSTAITAFADQAGTRAASYLASSSRIVVPHNASWAKMGAVRIATRIRFNQLTGQTNIAEIDRSVALSVREDGVVTFAVYAPKTPATPDPDSDIDDFTIAAPPIQPTDPFETLTANPLPPFEWTGLNTTAEFAPDGQTRNLPTGAFVEIMAEHDGLGSMRIWIDGTLAAIRQNLEHRVLPLVPPGQVTIGARPQDNAHTLNGAIDRLRIWRDDPQAPYEQFFCREVTPKAKKCWRGIYGGIAQGLDDPKKAATVTDLLERMDSFSKALAKALARLEGEDRKRLLSLSKSYQRLWCQNLIDSDAMSQVVGDMLDLIEQAMPGALHGLFADIFGLFSDPDKVALLTGGACVAETDPKWPVYIRTISDRFPLPPGMQPPDPKTPTNQPGYGTKAGG